MSKNVHIIPRERKALKPLVAGSGEDSAWSKVVIDEQTYWTGKDYSFEIENATPYTRWYRLVVTNLQRDTEYAVFSQYGRLNDRELIQIETGDLYEISIVLGGDAESDPKTPRSFQVYVEEHSTRDERGKPKIILDDTLHWIPRLHEDSIFITVPKDTLRVYPWQRRATFDVSLVNRSYLPITAAVVAAPTEDSAAVGLEGTSKSLKEPIPAQTEQTVQCAVVLENRLKSAVQLTVDATAEVPALDMQQAVKPKMLHIVPISIGAMWQAWAIAAAVLFLLVWLLFGMLPFVHPTTTVLLKFDGISLAEAKPKDLKVTLTPVNPKTGGATLEPLVGQPVPSERKDGLLYYFDWGWKFRGFRWTWIDNDLQLTAEPTNDKNKNLFTGFNIATHLLKDVSVSRYYGVSQDHIDDALDRRIGVTLKVTLDPATKPADDKITLSIAVNGTNVLTTAYVSGVPITLSDEAINKSKSIIVDIEAKATTSLLEAHQSVPVSPRTEPYEVVMSFGDKTAGINIPAGDPPTPFQYVIVDAETQQRLFGGTSSKGEPVTYSLKMRVPRRKVKVTISALGSIRKSQILDLEPDKSAEVAAWKIEETKPPVDPGKDPVVPNFDPTTDPKHQTHTEHGPKIAPSDDSAKQIAKWCAQLRLTQYTNAFIQSYASQKAPIVKLHVDALGNNEVSLLITSNDDCLVQIYDVATDGNWNAVFGPNGELYGKPATPIHLTAGQKLQPVTLRIANQTGYYVALVYRPDPSVALGDADLHDLRKSTSDPETGKWFITGISYTGQ